MKKIMTLLLTAFVAIAVSAQDIHFSQYWGSPLNLNPALSGVFDDNVRFNANYRNQWFAQSTFATYAIAVDANLWRKKMRGNFVGAGISMFHDTEGNGTFSNTAVNLALSYNIKIGGDFKTKHYLGLGLQAGYFYKAINMKNIIYGNLYEENNNFDPLDFANYQNKGLVDFGLGVSYFSSFDRKHNVAAGVAISHIAEQNIAFENAQEDVLYRKITAHASALMMLDKKIGLIPTGLFQAQGPHQELDMGAYLKFVMNDRTNTIFYAGAQYRLAAFGGGLKSDAIIPGVRMEYQTLDVGLAYDITVSELRNASAFMGGPEIYVIYTIPSSPRNKSFIGCPKF